MSFHTSTLLRNVSTFGIRSTAEKTVQRTARFSRNQASECNLRADSGTFRRNGNLLPEAAN